MSVQIRNASMVSLLEADFIKRNEPGNLLGNVISTYQALPGLRGFWPMSSVDENGDVYDATMQGRTLTNTNTVTFSNTDFLPYAEFDGSTNYLTRADEAGLDITGDLTTGAWVKFNNALGADEIILSKYGSAGQRSWRVWRQANGTIRALVSVDGTATNSKVSTELTSASVWYFTALRLTASSDLAVVVDDNIQTGGTAPASIFNSTTSLKVGWDLSTFFLDGDIALPFLCAYALPDNMINNLYQQSRVLFEGQ